MEIHNKKWGPEVRSTPFIKAGAESAAKITASKVGEVAEVPVPKERREIRQIRDVKQLYKQIQRDWNLLSPSELAEQIVELEDRVSLMEGSSPEIEKIKAVAEKLHFQFVFPVVLELSSKPEPNMPHSFARVVHSVAKQILDTGSLLPIKQLSSTQIDKVMRYARGGG